MIFNLIKRSVLVALAFGCGFLSFSTNVRAESSERIGADGVFNTDRGPVRCTVVPNSVACLGIPYAAPPVGDLRFRPPMPTKDWTEPRDATRLGAACLQAATDYDRAQGAEDCLYLNLYKPVDEAEPKKPLPVMVWLHGGGFVNGSGNAFNGAFLAQTAHAIVVTVNYRLGPFGWLALPSLGQEAPDHSTGNYGLLDSIAALQWVKRNATAFGGDPTRVTLFGQSAGGEQTLALIASPYAAGLFERAISMSAPAAIPLPSVEKSAAKRTAFLEALGCTDVTTQPSCLRKIDAQRMLSAAAIDWNLIKNGGLGWTATVDGAVLPDQWVTLFKTGRFNKVPVVIGHTKEEGRLFVAIYDNAQQKPITEDQVVAVTQKAFGPAASLVRWKYPLSDFASPGDQLAQALTDSQFAAGESNDRVALASYVPVYGYESCDPDAPESHVHAIYSKIGCGHDSDLAYLFQWDDFSDRQPSFTDEQRALAVTMGRYWGQFAATGNPNGEGLPPWPAITANESPIQMLETASSGGVRSSAPGAYDSEHKLAIWRWMLWFASLIGK